MMIKTSINSNLDFQYDALILPFSGGSALAVSLPAGLSEPVQSVLGKGLLGKCGDTYELNIYTGGKILKVVLVETGRRDKNTGRETYIAMAKAFQLCKAKDISAIGVLIDNAEDIARDDDILLKVFELPYLVYYAFDHYKTEKTAIHVDQAVFVTDRKDLEAVRHEAEICGGSTVLARDLVNHPSMFMTPAKLAEEALHLGSKSNIDVVVYDKKQIEEMKMDTFLAVSRGSKDEPKVIVLRYQGGGENEKPIALVGKGLMYDSGGYSIKSSMEYMHNDMAGAAAVIGAIQSIAAMGLKVNVVSVIAACKNMISCDAYVPGDILNSMNGKTIEMLNSDAEGRLTLADAVTYAIRKEGAERIIDIATLTGAARNAVGNKTAAVIANNDELFYTIKKASGISCEKIWRLDADKELLPALKSNMADIRNTCPGNPYGGGTIVGGLFIQEFVEDQPWAHVDIASVAWVKEGVPYCPMGATGFGVSLLYHTVKALAAQ